MHRIAITLKEDGSEISEEGLSEDIFEAIRDAKDKLLKTLSEIQNDVITNQDRTIQIKSALAGGTVH
jgi:ribosome-associated translation inhibitor RaiA